MSMVDNFLSKNENIVLIFHYLQFFRKMSGFDLNENDEMIELIKI